MRGGGGGEHGGLLPGLGALGGEDEILLRNVETKGVPAGHTDPVPGGERLQGEDRLQHRGWEG